MKPESAIDDHRADQDLTVPVLPSNAREILSYAFDDFVELQDFGDVLSRDPAISGRLISLANSAYFSLPEPVLDVESAVVRVLGLDLTRGVAIGMAFNSMLQLDSCPAFDVERYWRKALGSSAVAGLIVKQARRDDLAGTVSLAALLQDIGVLVSVASWPTDMQSLLSDSDASLADGMVGIAGMDHDQLTCVVMNAWEMPSSLIECVSALHAPGVSNTPSSAAISVANEWIAQPDPYDMSPDVRKALVENLSSAGLEHEELPELGRKLRDVWEVAGQFAPQPAIP